MDFRIKKSELPSVGLHRFLLFLSFATLLLIIAGALVTSNDAGLSVPDWPTSFGSFRMPPMVGGVLYEHGHRMIAVSIGLLTILLTLWIFIRERRSWIKKLGLISLLGVILQGVFGGITVRFFLPPPVSTIHACLAHLFFSLLVSLAVFTSPGWNQEKTTIQETGGGPLRTLAVGAVSVIFLQLFMGAAFRHHWFNLVPHFLGAALVTILVSWTAFTVIRRHGDSPFLIRPAYFSIGLLVAQLILGPVAYFSLRAAANEPQPHLGMVALTVAHVAVGALILATMLVLTLRLFRVMEPRRRTVEATVVAENLIS